MRTIEVSDALVLEIQPGSDGSRALMRLINWERRDGGEAFAGIVVIWPAEIRHLIEALAEAAGILAEAELPPEGL